ncbi:MAG: 5,10-methylenetetrahydrofolate reductase [Actinobacteria bacterium]|nr:MAG: 5,10-methylenetetrahydrofolate reductase [Actinomycetota bacterium]
MALADALNSGKFVVTGELTPPKGVDTADMVAKAKVLEPVVDAINVTDNPSARMQMSSLGGCLALIDAGFEPVYQLTCRDRNRLALQSELLTAASQGVRNVLALTGDHTKFGDHPQSKPVFDLDAVQLLQAIEALNGGRDMSGNELKGATSLLAGASVAPEAEPWEAQRIKFEKKVEAGATFFQTQAVFDMQKLERLARVASKLKVKVLAGLILLKSARMVEFLNAYVPGIIVPEGVVGRLAESDKPSETGIEIAVEQVARFKELCDGVHMMVMGAEDRVAEILERAGVTAVRA